jgi:Domain of unknown function (DUF932)
MNIFKASNQWSNRPADERFESLQDLFTATKRYADEAVEKRAEFGDLRVEAVEGEVNLVGRQGIPAKLTNWAFGQLCQRVQAPASYLRELPATLAAQNLNHGLASRVERVASESLANLLFHKNGSWLLRSILSDDYKRIWNWEIAQRLLDLEARWGWTPAKPTTHWGDDTVGTCIVCSGSKVSSKDGVEGPCNFCKGTGKELPSLYASDHDMFAFLVNTELTVEEKGSDGAMFKGVIVENSEVGASALKLSRFLGREICGNHIIWGVSKYVDISIRHVGNANQKWSGYFAAIKQYADESVSEIEAKIAASKVKLIADSKENVLDALFGKRQQHGLSRTMLEAGYNAVNEEQDGDPNTVWGFVQGLTRHSQTLGYADKRTDVDRAAGKILDLF